jgi:AAA15 family ATPase/GTPase
MTTEGISTLISKGSRNIQTIVNKVPNGNDYFRTEFAQKQGKSWQYAFKLGAQKSGLGNLPADETQFPATTWLRNLLIDGVQSFVLNSLLIRKASPPGQGRGFKPDGSNLPWVIDELNKKSLKRFKEWIAHLQTALPDIENITTIERADDRHRYLVIKYMNGLEVPSWVASDGTLRLLALTLPAYLPELKGIYLIEEPENGIHPRAVETIFQSLVSVYDAQILMATHSPVILGISNVQDVLCFAKTTEGATDIVAGNLHPALARWKGETNLGVLFAAGVLG